jgi:3-phenylpropionate/cinnamic acid dioxygenase small subunit
MGDERSDRDQITDVLVRYATGIDRQDWPRFRTCFTADVHADYGEIGVWDGVDAITEFMATTHEGMPATNHMLSNVAIDLDGDSAKVVTYVHAVLVVSRDPEHSVDAVGSYADTFVRTADGWRIRERTFTQTRVTFS